MLDKMVPERERFWNILHKYFVNQKDAAVQEKLQYYQSYDVIGIKIFWKLKNALATNVSLIQRKH